VTSAARHTQVSHPACTDHAMHVQRRTTSQCVLITALLFLGLSSESICQQIEPHLYAKIFEVNKPAWVRLADLIKQNVPVSHEGPRVLDIGAGPGEPTATMARLLPTHTFVLTDKQEPMVEKAKVRTKDMTNIEFHVASAEDLSIFPSASFDAVTGCYVLMFVDLDKTLQVRNVCVCVPEFQGNQTNMFFCKISIGLERQT